MIRAGWSPTDASVSARVKVIAAPVPVPETRYTTSRRESGDPVRAGPAYRVSVASVGAVTVLPSAAVTVVRGRASSWASDHRRGPAPGSVTVIDAAAVGVAVVGAEEVGAEEVVEPETAAG
ncbi:hypothetical protein, partial [Lapillicoccus jejuensis]